MTNPQRPARRSLRLPGYDYSQPGAYFFTAVCQDRALLLTSVAVQSVVTEVWGSIPTRYPAVSLDAFVVMPNHVHGVVIINETNGPPTLGHVLGYFKSHAGRAVNGLRATPGPPVWQRG